MQTNRRHLAVGRDGLHVVQIQGGLKDVRMAEVWEEAL